MEKRKVGTTGLEVTPLCFGASELGRIPLDQEDQADAVVNAIFDSEVNFLDTSRNYGMGRSEARIGRVIRARGGLPAGFVLATKLDRDMETGRFDADQARRSLEESLEALSLDRFDILHFHDPEYTRDIDEITRPGGAFDALFQMKEEGLASAVGLAMGKLELMDPLLRSRPFDVLVNHNRWTLLNRSADALYDYAAEQGIAIFNAAPYAGGVLAKGADALPKITYQEASAAELEPVRAIEAVCARHGVPVAAAALDFSLSDPRITSTIVGVSRPGRIAETLSHAATTIPEALRADLAALPFQTTNPEATRIFVPDT